MALGKWSDLRDAHLQTPEARALYEQAGKDLEAELMRDGETARCPVCGRTVPVNLDGKLRKHKGNLASGGLWRNWCPNRSPRPKARVRADETATDCPACAAAEVGVMTQVPHNHPESPPGESGALPAVAW